MRLHWFLPLKRGQEGKTPLRRALRFLGPTWLASPWRRLVQVLCLAAFLWLFLYVAWPYTVAPPELPPEGWPSHYADELRDKELLPAASVLALDPLVSITAAIASRAWVWSLPVAGALLLLSLLVPRGFCGYVCPLGTCLDLFDGTIGRHLRRLHIDRVGWLPHIRFAILGALVTAALAGVTLAGYVAAIPVLTRGLAFVVSPLQLGLTRGFHQVPPLDGGKLLSIGLFAAIFALGLLRPRFWCRYLCPTGALFSVVNLLRLTKRSVRSGCVACGRCETICPFEAIESDYSTRDLDCTFCQTCGGACPVEAIEFRGRFEAADPLAADTEPSVGASDAADPRQRLARTTPEVDAATGPSLSRRRLLLTGTSLALGGAAGAGLGGLLHAGQGRAQGASGDELPVRPPGSVPEDDFLRMCIRCGECFQACPNNVLQPTGLAGGVRGLWTPRAAFDWSGCEPSCNLCGQVCPTGAIRALPLAEKRVARMGLAVVDTQTCLPHAGRGECRLCLEECQAAGYNAIEVRPLGEGRVQATSYEGEMQETRTMAPVVRADKCVGCGLCQSRCYHVLVDSQKKLSAAAIVVRAGAGREDRMHDGSYIELREQEKEERRRALEETLDVPAGGDAYLPDFL